MSIALADCPSADPGHETAEELAEAEAQAEAEETARDVLRDLAREHELGPYEGHYELTSRELRALIAEVTAPITRERDRYRAALEQMVDRALRVAASEAER